MNAIRIVTDKGQVFDYHDVEELNIRLNRIVDDYQDIEARFGEFSYHFDLPMTINNNLIFKHSNVFHADNKFFNKKYGVTVFLNSTIIFKGFLELIGIENGNYRCVLLSKVTELIDDLGEKNMREITTLPDIRFDYENTIRTHIENNYMSSDETFYQFPFIYYSTYFTPKPLINRTIDFMGYMFHPDRAIQNYYYIVNKYNRNFNSLYYHQFPLAIYLVSALRAVLEEVGWNFGGSFFETDDLKKIIIPYVGENDIYDRSLYCTEKGVVTTGGTCTNGDLYLKTANFLPDMSCKDFISNLINLFNLYFTVDLENRIISFETYNTIFNNFSNPYSLDDKIDVNSISMEKIENDNPSIFFNKADNNAFFGDNTYYTDANFNALTQQYKKSEVEIDVYNYKGTTGKILLDFGEPIIARKFLRNTENIEGTYVDGLDSVIFLPQLTRQTLKDNQNKPFYKKDDDTVSNNTEETIKHDGLPSLFYYYGISEYNDFEQQVGKGDSYLWFWIYLGGTKTKIPFASPYAYFQFRDNINFILINELDVYKRTYASGIQSIYLMMGNKYLYNNNFSLVLSEQGDVYPTIYNYFHENKYKRYQKSYVLTATVKLTINDYNALQMQVPIKYNNQIYSLMSIEDYDPVNGLGIIKMIKTLT